MDKSFIKVSELNEKLKYSLENDDSLKSLSIKGEVANLTHNIKGHIYFSLKDADSKIDCAIWKFNAHKFKNLNIEEGTEIIATGNITYYVKTGKITYVVNDLKIDGIGELNILYNKRFNQLKESGWFNDERKKPIPKLPKNIGVVTAATGDAVRDIINSIKRRFPLVNLFIFPAMVQGDESAKDIASKIQQANNFKTKLDVLIVGRGGGSYEDLWSFNEMEVLNAIYNSEIPIITGIGHEADFTIADYVSDARASTPTAAGEKATPDVNNLQQLLNNKLNMFIEKVNTRINYYKEIINTSSKNYITIINNKIENSKIILNNQSNLIKNFVISKLHKYNDSIKNTKQIYYNSILNKIKYHKIEISNWNSLWEKLIIDKLKDCGNKLMNYQTSINSHDPNLILSKGYSIIKNNNKILRSKNDFDNIDIINVTLNDGDVDLNIKKGN
ncbi:exodeoxyribonuclease VII large subunit [Spiroplasma turonicum]|uniref:Exodeoxyribonuclease 7 large subunit n=1 Tax=Spiroplasma turonicum TaxID=216946 RepID=A0A0K1P636_9MOLU|nr:exodeoxyribonuclease VII large subunit [Spiroplasma turonicum]AKU79730.1 exodeoxyribonuclease VII large subunit [Spiroplasma turonicum]ALX70748.1 exodeoxyribonuclease VII large subunit [Spiroplasma turonicum]